MTLLQSIFIHSRYAAIVGSVGLMNATTPIRIAFSVGELSGDEHSARVALALSELIPECELRGMGGRNMRAAGVQTIVDSEVSASVMGFGAILGSASKIINAMRTMRRLIDEWHPDVLILTDYPDFNLRLARYAHQRRIPTLYFIPPKVWAWRGYRVKQIAATIDQLAVIFPFELDFYRSHGINQVEYVGHPMSDTIDREPLPTEERAAQLLEIGLDSTRPVIGLFPGSRKGEVSRHLPPMRAAFDYVSQHIANAQAIISIAPTMNPALISQYGNLAPHVVTSSIDSVSLLKLTDAALMKSGTSNLQAAFVGVPFAMCYGAAKWTEFIVRPLLRIKQFSPVNVVRADTVLELLQEELKPNVLGPELERLVTDLDYRREVQAGLQQTVALLSNAATSGAKTSAARVALLVLRLIHAKGLS